MSDFASMLAAFEAEETNAAACVPQPPLVKKSPKYAPLSPDEVRRRIATVSTHDSEMAAAGAAGVDAALAAISAIPKPEQPRDAQDNNLAAVADAERTAATGHEHATSISP